MALRPAAPAARPGARSRPAILAAAATAASGSMLARGRGGVLLVGDLVAPVGGDVVVVDLVEREMDHEAVGGGAVPVVLVGLEEDAVAGTDDLDRAAAALAEPDALRDVDRLAKRVRVPRGPRARREVHQVGLHACGRWRGRDGVDVDVA